MADIAQRGNRLTFAKGGRAGHALGHTAGRLLTKTLERVGGGPEGKPHSTKKGRIAAGVRRIKRGARTKKFGGGRTNLLEELGRVEAEPSNPNRRAEISRVHGELNRGYKKGGRARHFAGSLVKNIPKLLKKLGTEIKAQPLPPKLQKTLDEVKKLQKLQKPGVKKAAGGRTGFVIGGAAARLIAKKLRKKKKVYPETEDLTHQKGPYVGDVGSERKKFKKGGTDKNWIQKAVDPKHKGFCTPMTKKTCTPRRKALARTFKKMGRERKAKG